MGKLASADEGAEAGHVCTMLMEALVVLLNHEVNLTGPALNLFPVRPRGIPPAGDCAQTAGLQRAAGRALLV